MTTRLYICPYCGKDREVMNDFENGEFLSCSYCERAGKITGIRINYTADKIPSEMADNPLIERYDEETGSVKLLLSEAIEEEINIFRTIMKSSLMLNNCVTKIESCRNWRLNKDCTFKVSLTIEKLKDVNTK